MLLQWQFINARARQSFEDQTSSVTASLLDVFEQNHAIENKICDIQRQKVRNEYKKRATELIEMQHKYLTPLLPAIEQTIAKHEQLISAMYSSAHSMPIVDVTLDEPSLVEQLKKSSQALDRSKAVLSRYMDKVRSLASSLADNVQTVKEELSELAPIESLLLQLETLHDQEQSFRAQMVQQSRAMVKMKGGVPV